MVTAELGAPGDSPPEGKVRDTVRIVRGLPRVAVKQAERDSIIAEGVEGSTRARPQPRPESEISV